jgi:AP-4 complex subunit sigma-1
MLNFLLMVNKQGQTRVTRYFTFHSVKERVLLEGELVRRCLIRGERQCSFFDYEGYRVIYRRYASLYFIIGLRNASADGGELEYLEFIHNLVETMDKYFENICELDIMFNLEKVHFILNEMLCNGRITESNRTLVLQPLQLLDKYSTN